MPSITYLDVQVDRLDHHMIILIAISFFFCNENVYFIVDFCSDSKERGLCNLYFSSKMEYYSKKADKMSAPVLVSLQICATHQQE